MAESAQVGLGPGTQVYHASELPTFDMRGDWISLMRSPDEVFHPASIRSRQRFVVLQRVWLERNGAPRALSRLDG
jgi:hypothetical protein